MSEQEIVAGALRRDVAERPAYLDRACGGDLGLALVLPNGRPASRGRVLWRNFVAFLPYLLLGGAASVLGDEPNRHALGVSLLALLTIITVVSLLLPGRSLQDRLARTYLVPR